MIAERVSRILTNSNNCLKRSATNHTFFIKKKPQKHTHMSKTHWCMSHPLTWRKLFDRLLPQNMAHKCSILFPIHSNTQYRYQWTISSNFQTIFLTCFTQKTYRRKFFPPLSNTHTTYSTYLYSKNFSSVHASSIYAPNLCVVAKVTYGSLLTRIFNHIILYENKEFKRKD